MGFLGTTELVIILAIVILLFGGSRLPALGKGIGGAIKNFRDGMRSSRQDQKDGDAVV